MFWRLMALRTWSIVRSVRIHAVGIDEQLDLTAPVTEKLNRSDARRPIRSAA